VRCRCGAGAACSTGRGGVKPAAGSQLDVIAHARPAVAAVVSKLGSALLSAALESSAGVLGCRGTVFLSSSAVCRHCGCVPGFAISRIHGKINQGPVYAVRWAQRVGVRRLPMISAQSRRVVCVQLWSRDLSSTRPVFYIFGRHIGHGEVHVKYCVSLFLATDLLLGVER
jgi:hypothetical protein